MERKYVMTALGYALIGLLLGMHMAGTHVYTQHVTHAHIMLLGFVVSFIYAMIHRLYLTNSDSTLSRVQFWLHQIGSLGIFVGLFLLYQGRQDLGFVEPMLGASSVLVLLGLIIIKILFIKATKDLHKD